MREMRRQGISVVEIARTLVVSASLVVKHTKDLRVRAVRSDRDTARNANREADIVSRVRRGETFDEIGRFYGITRARVGQIIQKYEERTGDEVKRRAWAKPKPAAPVKLSDAQRLLSRARLNPETGCWHWIGPVFKTAKGITYPLYPVAGERYAHRGSYRLWRGEIPDKHFIVPRCPDGLCINPFHQEAVPAKDRFRESEKWDNERGTWKHAPAAFGRKSKASQ
jgi:hypothetical protein